MFVCGLKVLVYRRCGFESLNDLVLHNSQIPINTDSDDCLRICRETRLFVVPKSYDFDVIILRDCLDIFCSIWSANKSGELPRKPLSEFLLDMIKQTSMPEQCKIPAYNISRFTKVKLNKSDNMSANWYNSSGLISDAVWSEACDYRNRFYSTFNIEPTL